MEEGNKKKQKGGERGEAIPVEDYNTEQRIAIRLLLDTIANTPDARKIRTDIIASRILPHFTTTQLSILFRNNKLLLHWVRSADVWKKIAYIKIPEAELQRFETIIWEIVEDGPINYKWLLYIWEEWHFVQKFDFSDEDIFVEYKFIEKQKQHPIFGFQKYDDMDPLAVYYPTIKGNRYHRGEVFRLWHSDKKLLRSFLFLFERRNLKLATNDEIFINDNIVEAEALLELGNQRNFILMFYTVFTVPDMYIQRLIEGGEIEEDQDRIRGELFWNK